MMPKSTGTYERVAQLVDEQELVSCLLLREDFAACGPEAEVEAALDRLVANDRLARLREDAYAFTEISPYTGQLTLRCTIQNLAEEYAMRQGADICLTEAQADYASGRSKQIPNGAWVGVTRPVLGTLRYGRQEVGFECV